MIDEDSILSVCGYKKTHPLEDIIIFNIALNVGNKLHSAPETNPDSFGLMPNPNPMLDVNLSEDKKNIEISQIREMITYANKSTFNNNERIILIDNVESLNLNSVNALLKIVQNKLICYETLFKHVNILYKTLTLIPEWVVY